MGNRKLLDCTLRDGGYVNDWKFGHDQIVEIFKRLISAGIDVVEIGFLDDRRAYDDNRTIMPDTQAINKIFGGLDKGNSIVVAMIDYGTCRLEHIQHCSDTFIDGIRVIFKEPLMYEALDFCKQLKQLGYIVYAQMVSVTTYTDEKLKEYAELVNSVEPYATSMVDTYGLMHPFQLLHIFEILNTYLNPQIAIGFHGHNNLQMAYANAIAYLNSHTSRILIVDGTLYGMGKSAGNAPSELLAAYMNHHYGITYDIIRMLETIDTFILEIYQKQYWGYTISFFIAACYQCHPNYINFLIDKKTLSVKQIIDMLQSIIPSKKLMYDAAYAEKLYVDYQSIQCDDTAVMTWLKQVVAEKNIVILGPGNNLNKQKYRVKKYIKKNKPLIMAVNFVPADIKVDYIFLTNAKRYSQLADDMGNSVNNGHDIGIIATSNVTKTKGSFPYVLNFSTLIDTNTEIIDNSLVMLIKAMIKVQVKCVNLAGFDGYSRKNDNYFNASREYTFVKEKAGYLNGYISDFLASVKEKITVNFITSSRYKES